jgi:uncharacterized membrane protein
MLRNTLLTIHILGVVVWLGFGFYEILLMRELKRLRGTPAEAPLIGIYGKYGGIVAIATLVVAVAGILMSALLGWGFFRLGWLGIKQALMLAILLDMAYLAPTFGLTYKAIAEVAHGDRIAVGEFWRLHDRIEPHVVAMRIAGVLAVALAVSRPTFG